MAFVIRVLHITVDYPLSASHIHCSVQTCFASSLLTTTQILMRVCELNIYKSTKIE
jgi:hypothetical protein